MNANVRSRSSAMRSVVRVAAIAAAVMLSSTVVVVTDAGATHPEQVDVGGSHEIEFDDWAGRGCASNDDECYASATVGGHDRETRFSPEIFVWAGNTGFERTKVTVDVLGEFEVAGSPNGADSSIEAVLGTFGSIVGRVDAVVGRASFDLSVRVFDDTLGAVVLSETIASISATHEFLDVKGLPVPKPDLQGINSEFDLALPFMVVQGHHYTVRFRAMAESIAGAGSQFYDADEALADLDRRLIRVSGARVQLASDSSGLLDVIDEKVDKIADDVTELLESQRRSRQFEQESALESCTVLSMLYLPAAHGGELEDLIALMRSRIDAHEEAGMDVRKAPRYLQEAENHMARGDYERSFASLCKGYHDLQKKEPAS